MSRNIEIGNPRNVTNTKDDCLLDGGWMKRVLLFLILAVSAPGIGAASLEEAFSYKLPVDFYIGQIIEPAENSIEEQSLEALKEPYTPAWVETYIPEGMRQGFVHTYDHLLSSYLPSEKLQIGKPVKIGALVEIPFRMFSPKPLIGLLVWVENDEGDPFLLSLSISE